MMKREEALTLVKKYMETDTLVKHCLATEAIMRKIASRLDQDPERFGLIGLLHDIDFDETKDIPEKHTLQAEKILRENGFDDDFIRIIQSHNAEEIGRERTQPEEFALTASESITGLIVATTLVYPDKKLASVKAKSIKKRMKEKAFARSVSRERIQECEKFGIPLAEFIEISLEAMREISEDLGL